jgi:tRNA(Arg) A34 adenosine deaminase TadA
MDDEAMMRLALAEARKAAEEGEVPVGAGARAFRRA